MKAIVRDEYGTPDVLRVAEVDDPVPGPGQVVVRVKAASVNTADLDQLEGTPRAARLWTGIGRPRSRRLGLDMSGVVEDVGDGVSVFSPGDGVWADMFPSGGGAFAEYVCANEKAFHPKPDDLSFQQAAAIPHSGILALQGLDARGGVASGEGVLINGAGGCVGPFAIQIAKARGAEVTAVDHREKLDMIRSLGADHVLDYTREDFTRGTRCYDFILDIAARRTLLAHRGALAPHGSYVRIAKTVGGFLRAATIGSVLGYGTRSLGVFSWVPNRRGDLDRLAGLVLRGDMDPHIDRSYPLDAVPEAMCRQRDGKARGKLVVIV